MYCIVGVVRRSRQIEIFVQQNDDFNYEIPMQSQLNILPQTVQHPVTSCQRLYNDGLYLKSNIVVL